MVAPLRRLFVTLLGVAACTPVLAGVVCVQNSDGTWTCSGDGNFDPEHDPHVVTNVVGVCTNCISISPEECQQLKSHILDVTDDAWNSAWSLRDTLLQSQSILDDVISEGDSFEAKNYNGSTNTFLTVRLSPQWGYTKNRGNNSKPGSLDAGSAAVNSIANYYNEGVRPALSFVRDNLSSMESDLDVVIGSVDHLYNFVNENVDCQACTASFDGPSSTTNTPSGGGSSTCPDCPCKEQMEALQNLLKDDFLPRIKKIDANVAQLTNLITIAKNQLDVTKQGFHNTTNLLNRLDDYVLDDFSNKVVQLNLDVNFIASNLAAKVRGLFINDQYSNSTFYVAKDNIKVIDIEHLHEQLITENDTGRSFDWEEYKDLTWFERIEYMLLNLGGFYNLTNSLSGGTTNYSSVQSKLQQSSHGFTNVLGSAQTGFSQVQTAFSDFNSSVRQAFGSTASSVGNIPLITNYLNSGEDLILKLDPDIVDFCRVVTSLLWTATFAVLGFRIVLSLWKYTIIACSFLLRTAIGSIK